MTMKVLLGLACLFLAVTPGQLQGDCGIFADKLAHPSDCTRYYIISMHSCPEGQWYDQVTRECTSPANATCNAETTSTTTESPTTTDSGFTDESTDGQTETDAPTTDGQTETDITTDGQTETDGPTTDGQTETDAPTTDGQTETDAPTTDGQTETDAPTTDGHTETDAPTTDGQTETDITTDGQTETDGTTTDGTNAPTTEYPTETTISNLPTESTPAETTQHTEPPTDDTTYWTATTESNLEQYPCPNVDDPNNRVRYPHEDNCNLYYLCTDGSPLLYRCQNLGLHFDPIRRQCRTINAAGCDRCPDVDPPGDFVRLQHESVCQYYYRCENTVPSIYQCWEGELFSRMDRVCTTPENAWCLLPDVGTNHTIPVYH